MSDIEYPYDYEGEWETVWVAEKLTCEDSDDPGRSSGSWYISPTFTRLRMTNYNAETGKQYGMGRIWKIKLPQNKLFHITSWDPYSDYPENSGFRWKTVIYLDTKVFFDLIQDIKEQINKVMLSQVNLIKANKERKEVILLTEVKKDVQ